MATSGSEGVWDPLQFQVPLPLSVRLFPLGFPLELECNDPRVIGAARASFGCFRPRFEAPPIRIHVCVAPGRDSLPDTAVFRGRGHLLSIVCDDENYAACDLRDSFASVRITEAVAEEGVWLRHRFLETIVYATLVQERLTAVHAAVVSRNGRGVLLCARPGTGKSTLAYACANRGWTFVSDDAAYMLNGDWCGRVLGKPYSLRMKTTAAQVFPELGRHAETPDVHGEPHFELGSGELARFDLSEECEVAAVVLLERDGESPARLTGVPREDTLSRLIADVPGYGPEVCGRHRAAMERLLEVPCRLLRYRGYDEAIPVLERLVSEGGA